MDTTTPPTLQTSQSRNPQDTEWIFSDRTNIYGPFKESELLANGLTPDMLVWSRYLPKWCYAREVPVLSYLFDNTIRDEKISGSHPIIQDEDSTTQEVFSDIGNPWIIPVITLIVVVSVVIYSISQHYSYFRYYDDKMILKYFILPFSFPVIGMICALWSAYGAGTNKSVGDYDRANRMSGAATAWGWSVLIFFCTLWVTYLVLS